MTVSENGFSRIENVALLPAEGKVVQLAADEAERQALADQFAIAAVEALSAEVTIEKRRKGGLRVRGRLDARIVQTCVVTLEPVVQTIEEEIDVTFVEPERAPRGERPGAEILIDPEADEPEEFDGNSLDVGALVAEHLALAIDPYPRAPQAEFSPPEEPGDADEEGEAASPFAVLRSLKENP